MGARCNGTCPGLEHNGVCEVPQLCPEYTDCDDCAATSPLLKGIAVAAVAGFSLTMSVFVFLEARRLRVYSSVAAS